jgi:hypothetical protein
MSYSPAAAAATEPPFDNVFVDPVSYGMFSRTGRWRKGTVLVLAIRGGHSKESINKQGAFQAGQPRAVEAHVMLFVSPAERGRRYDLRPILLDPAADRATEWDVATERFEVKACAIRLVAGLQLRGARSSASVTVRFDR